MPAKQEKRLKGIVDSLKKGKVYRASDFSKLSTSPSRDLNLLAKANLITYLGKGLYLKPRKLGKLDIPPRTEDLISVFLKTDKFLIRNLSDFNMLRLGTTQLFKEVHVYNERRDGRVRLGNKTYHFKKKKFPSSHYDEYLLVDMLNNLEKLGVEREEVLHKLKYRWGKNLELDKKVVHRFAKKYGKYWVKKFFEKME